LSLVTITDELYLSYDVVGDIHESPPTIFIHGIMGSKKNLLGFVKRFCEVCPNSPALIVDLRNHGQSSKHWMPYTVDAAASDIVALTHALKLKPRALVGHSFGGKVALMAAASIESIEQVWMLDCPPGAISKKNPLHQSESPSALEIIDILSGITWPLYSRKELVDYLNARGVTNAVSLWMTTNLHGHDEGLNLVFKPAEVRAMLNDFIALDCWPVVESLSKHLAIHLVAAEHGNRLSRADQVRLYSLVPKGQGYFHILAKSGHFVHADNPQGLLEIMKTFF
jgi:esterase